MNKEKIICIDGGGVLHRAIFNFMNCEATIPPTYTYLRMIIGYLKRLKVTIEDSVIVAQDYGRSWRKEIDKSYKSQRKEKREEKRSSEWWKEQYGRFDHLFEQLEPAINWQFIKIWSIESDDIASVISRYYKDNEVIHVSSDRDWEQLAIFPNTRIWSPISKKFKEIKSPMAILAEKINGDVSDNLLSKPSSEREWEIRKKIVDLTQLPDFVEQPIKEQLCKLMPKNLYVNKIPFHSVQVEIRKLYKL